jgi:hypothetical protein
MLSEKSNVERIRNQAKAERLATCWLLPCLLIGVWECLHVFFNAAVCGLAVAGGEMHDSIVRVQQYL